MTHPPEASLAELAQGAVEGPRREELEAHLEACADCRGVVASVLSALSTETESGPHRGQVVGRFVVLEPIGAGAIGEVFSSWDSVLERAVALKWLYPALLGSEGGQLRQRLLGEARALAKVQHPNVVSVFDVVEWGHTQVIVMELVPHATTLRHALAKKDWRAITTIYLDAARGLLAAHAAGVVHGDFKPDNVLLAVDGRVRVCDFGLSRAMPMPVSTGSDSKRSSVSGTPAYLSPERWSGQPADVSTDAYALCVSLWEALAGKHPFESREANARLAEMKKGPPPLPSGIPSRLEAALRRGLAFDAKDRFPSLAALAEELEQIITPSRSTPMFAAAALVAVLVLGGVSLHQWRAQCDEAGAPVAQVWTTARRVSIQAAFKKSGHPAAEALAATALAGLDAFAKTLGQTRHDACEATSFRGDSDALLTLRNVCVARRLADLDALGHAFETPDTKTVERSVLAVETLTQSPGCFDAATLGQVTPPPTAKRQAVDDAAKRVAEVRALRLTGHPKESIAAAPSALAAAEHSEWKSVIADAATEWGNGLERSGKIDEARVQYQRGLTLALEANDLALAFAAAVQLGFLEGYDANKREAGEAWLVMAKGLLVPARLKGTGEELRAVNVDATLLAKVGKAAEAAEEWASVVKGLGDAPSLNLARVMSNLGNALRESGHAAEGLVWHERSLKMMETLLGPVHPDIAAAANNLGSGLSDLQRFDEARPWFQKSLEIREKLFGPDALPLATTVYNLGELALRTGDGETALKQYGRSRTIVEKAKGADDDDVWDARLGEGLALELLGRHADAAALLTQVLPQIVERKFPAWNVAEAKLGLATALQKSGRDAARVKQLASEVAALEGPRHETQRARALALMK
jgi:eukaryotic-like serine/threonine-protein kinase